MRILVVPRGTGPGSLHDGSQTLNLGKSRGTLEIHENQRILEKFMKIREFSKKYRISQKSTEFSEKYRISQKSTEFPVKESQYPVKESQYPVKESQYPVKESQCRLRSPSAG